MFPAQREPSDEELARRVRDGDGDDEASKELFDRHVANLRARVRLLLPALLRKKVAESDVIQEAYLAAFLRLGDFQDEGEGSFGRWLSKILENKVRHEVRRYLGTAKRAAQRELAPAASSADVRAADPPDRGPTPSAAAIRREAREELGSVLAGLSGDHQTVMRMVNVQRLPVREVAQLMGRTEAAVYKLYARALAEFGRRLASARRVE